MVRGAAATGEELLLVHLLDSPRGSAAERHPSLTQSGIAQATGMDRSYVSVVLRRAAAGGLVERSMDRVRGSRRKLGVFALTPRGFEKALAVKQQLMATTVAVKVRGAVREMALGEALASFPGESAAAVLSRSASETLDADSSKPIAAEVAEARRLLDEDRQADCASLLRTLAGRWIRAGYHAELLEMAARIDKSRVPASDGGALLLAEADVRETQGDWEGARTCLDLVEAGEPSLKAEVLFRLGVLAYRRNDSDAVRLYYEALALAGRGDLLRGRILNAMGVLNWAAGRAEEAGERYEEAEKLAVANRDAEGLMRVRSNLGILAADAGDAAKAIALYGKAITVAEALADLKTVASLYSNVGDVYASKGDVAEARRFYGRSMALAERLSFTWQIAELHRSIAGVTDGSEREGHLRKALELFEKLGAESDVFKVREMMGEKA
jgi:tetratricopeptide (TPR) repeat protein